MSEQTPLRLSRANDNSVTGFSEFLAAEFLGIDDGGTGATTASGARTALGLGIGTDILAYDADLAAIAGLSHSDGNFIVSNGSTWIVESGSTVRDSLGLGTSNSPTFTNLTLSNDLTVTGDLTVQGDTTTINTATVTVEDVLMKLGSGNTVDTVDLGWYGEYVESSTTKYLGFTWDASADKFILWTGNQSEPNTLVDTGATGHATGTLIANIEGNVSGTLSATSTLADGVVATTQSAGDSSTKVATTAYVDTAVAGEDTLAEMNDVTFSGLANGDFLRYNGSNWINDPVNLSTDTIGDYVENLVAGTGISVSVTSGEGQTPTVAVTMSSFDTGDLTEGSNLYYTNARADARIAAASVGDLSDVTLTSTQTGDILRYNGSAFINEPLNLGTDTEGAYVASLVAGTGIDLANNTGETATPTITVDLGDFDTGDLSEGTNLYYTDARFDTRLATKDTGDLTEGTNLYYTDARFDTRLATKDTDDLTEGNNLYYTDARAQAVSINNVVEDTTPQLGGNLDLNSSNITGTGDIDTTGSFTLTSTSDTSAAGPIINLVRDSASPADADYLGQIKFKGDDDGGASTVYAKITGKIDDASAGTEDGLIEFAVIKDGSSNIAARLKSNNFQLLNGTGLEVAGSATITGDLTVNGTTTTIDTTNTVVSDSLIELANGTSGTPANDSGLIIERGSADNAFIGFDESEDKFKIGTGSFTGASTGNLTISTGTLIANLEGNASSATSLASAQNFSLTGDVTASAVSFDGSGAVALATTIASGAVDNDMLAGSIENVKLANSSITVTDGSNSTATALGGTITFSGTSNEVEVAESSGTITVGLPASPEITTSLGIGGGSTNGVVIEQGGIKIKNGGTQSYIDFYCESNNAHYARLQAPAHANFSGNPVITLPASTDTLVAKTTTDTLTNKTINLENNTLIVEYAVTVQNVGGSNKFLIDGEAQATISFRPGIVHRFDLSDNSLSGHPFKLSETSNGSHNSGSEYTTGKTTNGSQGSSGAYVEYTVNAATPDILYYYCSSHSGMGGTITVFGSSYGDSDVQSYLSAGAGISISGSGQISSTITQYADSDVQSYISAGSGISISGSGQISSTITQYADSDVASYLSANNYATQSYVQTQVSNVIDAAPGALDTLNELAAAIGDDANFSTTITNSIATKLATADFTSTANTWLGTKDTDDLSEGSTNLYFTNARFNTQLATKDTADLTEGTNLYFTNARADARIALANLEDLADVGFSSPGASEDQKVVTWDNSSSSFALSSVSGLSGSGETNTASNIGTAGVGLFDGKVGEDLQFKKINAGSAKITITDDTSNNEVDINLGTVSIDDLSDVDTTTSAPSSGQILKWNGTNFVPSNESGGTVTETFKTFAVSGQSDVVADSATDTITFVAGTNITLGTDASADSITINATGGAANAFSTIAVAGQSNVVADSETDTLTLTAGTGMTIETAAGTDTITFSSSGGGGGGSLPLTLAGSTDDPIVLSSITSVGTIPFTDHTGASDNIDLSGTSQTLTTFADGDGDTKIDLERTDDNDTVHIKAGGTDVLTATSSGVTISNLTVTGTSTQANEMKITDTLIELNAAGSSLGVDAGMVIERGSTGADAAFIWDESSDSFAVGTLSTDGAILFTKADGTSQPLPISSNEVAFNHADNTADNLPITSSSLAFTDASGDSDPISQVSYGPETDMSVKISEATLKAKTQTTGDNSTAVATTAFVQSSLGGISSDSVTDADNDTKIEVENSDADEIVMTTASQERLKVDNNVSMSARGGFFTHNLAMHASETFTIAATEGTVAAGPLDIQGTVDVQGSLVVL